MNKQDDIERAILGTVLIDSTLIPNILSLKPSDFATAQNRQTFEKVVGHYEAGLPIDSVTIERLGDYKDHFTSDMDSYVRLLQEHSRVRSIVEGCTTLIRTASDKTSDQLLKSLTDMTRNLDYRDEAQTIGDTMMAVVKRVDAIRLGEQSLGIKVGLDFEHALGGFEDGNFYVIAARPAMGKSALALELALRSAEQGFPVGFMSLEMSSESLATRMLCNKASMDMQLLRNGSLSDEKMQEIVDYASKIAELPITFDDSSFLTAQSLRSKAHAMHRRHGIKMLIIDYLQLITGDNDNRQQDVADASRTCKVIAKELGIPVIGLAQLNRGVEQRQDKRPLLSDLRESGAIEQDADAVLMMYRPEYYDQMTYDERDPESFRGDSTLNICEVITVKNRHGNTGCVRQVFIKEHMQFKNRARGHGF